MASKYIKIHIPCGNVSAIGPGKADLLEAIDRTGSISAAGRDLGISYRRAWDLVNAMNHCFKEPLVLTATGGACGGGAKVTEFGRGILSRYRAMVVKANNSVKREISELNALLSNS